MIRDSALHVVRPLLAQSSKVPADVCALFTVQKRSAVGFGDDARGERKVSSRDVEISLTNPPAKIT